MKKASLFDCGLAIIENDGFQTFQYTKSCSVDVPDDAVAELFSMIPPRHGVETSKVWGDDRGELVVTLHENTISIWVNGSEMVIDHTESLALRTALFGAYSYSTAFNLNPPEPEVMEVVAGSDLAKNEQNVALAPAAEEETHA